MEDTKYSVKDIFLIANLILALLVFMGDCVYIRYDRLWIKSITSVLFVVIGIVNLVYYLKNLKNLSNTKSKTDNIKFPVLMATGLTFAMLGDVILEINFIVGAALFAIGHVFYFVAYSVAEKPKWTDIIYILCIFVPAVLLITLAPMFDFGGVLMEIVCVIYAAVLSCMVGKAIANFARVKSKTYLIIMLGSILFFISDLTLLFNVFSTLPYMGVICLATYYPAEVLLGFAVFIYACVKNKPVAVPPETDTVDKSENEKSDSAEAVSDL